MDIFTLLVLAVGLAMDAFAVSVCKGLAMKRLSPGRMAVVGLWFGGFQALMPALGYALGVQFRESITSVDHWIAFGLLSLIGVNMIRGAVRGDEGRADDSLSPRTMFVLALATSIDALAVGITFAFLKVDLGMAVTLIGGVTFFLSCAGVGIGHLFGARYKAKAELAGGVILILLGVKILLEHTGVI